MSTSAKRRPTGNPSVRSVLAIGIGVDVETVACCEPPAHLVRHRTLHWELARIGGGNDLAVWECDDCIARFEAGISVALRAIEGIEEVTCVFADESRQNRGGQAVEIGAGQQPETRLLILGKPPQHDLRCRDSNGDYQAGHQHGDLYNQRPGGDVPQPHHQSCDPVGSSALPRRQKQSAGAQSKIQA